MKHPIYTALSLLSCAYLVTSNARGWSFIQSSTNRSALSSTAYRYRPAIISSGSSWSSGGGFHK